MGEYRVEVKVGALECNEAEEINPTKLEIGSFGMESVKLLWLALADMKTRFCAQLIRQCERLYQSIYRSFQRKWRLRAPMAQR